MKQPGLKFELRLSQVQMLSWVWVNYWIPLSCIVCSGQTGLFFLPRGFFFILLLLSLYKECTRNHFFGDVTFSLFPHICYPSCKTPTIFGAPGWLGQLRVTSTTVMTSGSWDQALCWAPH